MIAPGPWTCFFCDETFVERREAFLHFGADEACTPACQLKASEGGLIDALRAAEAFAAEMTLALHAESAEGIRAYQAAVARNHQAVRAAEEIGFERGVADQAATIARLRRIIARYGDRFIMANCARPDWQIEIDEAMRFVADNPEERVT